MNDTEPIPSEIYSHSKAILSAKVLIVGSIVALGVLYLGTLWIRGGTVLGLVFFFGVVVAGIFLGPFALVSTKSDILRVLLKVSPWTWKLLDFGVTLILGSTLPSFGLTALWLEGFFVVIFVWIYLRLGVPYLLGLQFKNGLPNWTRMLAVVEDAKVRFLQVAE